MRTATHLLSTIAGNNIQSTLYRPPDGRDPWREVACHAGLCVVGFKLRNNLSLHTFNLKTGELDDAFFEWPFQNVRRVALSPELDEIALLTVTQSDLPPDSRHFQTNLDQNSG